VALIDNNGLDIKIDPKNGKTNGEIIYNLDNLINLKDKYPNKVKLLIGNHDVPYIYHIKNKSLQANKLCTGYRRSIENELALLFYKNLRKFDVAYKVGNYMWSHAGITPGAYRKYFKYKINDNFDILAEELNRWFILDEPDLFHISYIRKGSYPYGSIFWADKSEFIIEPYDLPFTQIVGHSFVPEISYLYEDEKFTSEKRDKKINVFFTDVLNSKTDFLEMEI